MQYAHINCYIHQKNRWHSAFINIEKKTKNKSFYLSSIDPLLLRQTSKLKVFKLQPFIYLKLFHLAYGSFIICITTASAVRLIFNLLHYISLTARTHTHTHSYLYIIKESGFVHAEYG